MVVKSSLGLIFRTPEYGRVKKRLAREIGAEAALSAYKAMLNATIDNVAVLNDIDIYGFYEGKLSHEMFKTLRFKEIIPQGGDELGERLFNAITYLYKKGYRKIVLIGADTPDLPVKLIKEAYSKFDSFDVVIGPSEDGGYYLIGMKEPLAVAFKNIPWGSNEVLKRTILSINNVKISYCLLPEWYDIDDIDTLKRWTICPFLLPFLYKV